MITSSLLLAVQSTVPSTPEWSPLVGLTMILCNLLAIAIGYYGINKQHRGKASFTRCSAWNVQRLRHTRIAGNNQLRPLARGWSNLGLG